MKLHPTFQAHAGTLLGILACMLFALALHGQSITGSNDSLVLRFPPKPLDSDSIGPDIAFGDDYLLVSKNDYTIDYFQQDGDTYRYQCNINFTKESKGRLWLRFPYYFGKIEGLLCAGFYSQLAAYRLTDKATEVQAVRIVPFRGELVSSADLGNLYARQVENGHYRLYLPVGTSIGSKEVLLNPRDQEKFDACGRAEIHDLWIRDGHWKIKRLASFGTYRYDLGAKESLFLFRFGYLTLADSCVYLSSPSSEWIWKYSLDGLLLDSLQARGRAMPERFLEPMKEVSKAAIQVSHRKSCRFGTLFVLPDGKLARQYYLAEEPDGSRLTYLQIVDPESKSVSEVPLPKGTEFKAVWKGRLVQTAAWDYSRGYLKLSFWEVAH